MKKIYFTQEKIIKEDESTYLLSKFLGIPVFPLDFFEKHKVSNNDYYIMQINLKDLYCFDTPLPKDGYLYVFINLINNTPKIIYEKECDDLQYVPDINDLFIDICGPNEGYKLVFDESLNEGHYILGDIDYDLDIELPIKLDDYKTLLLIDFLALPESEKILQFSEICTNDGYGLFLIKDKDLQKQNYKNVIFTEIGD